MGDPQPEKADVFHETDDEWTTRILTSSPFADLLSDWQDARSSDPQNLKLPTTISLTAEKMSPYLRNVSVFDYISDEEIIYRFVGTDISRRMEHDVTGENVLDLSDSLSKSQIQKTFHRIVRTPEISLISYINAYSSGRHTGVTSLMVPIQGPGNTLPRVIALHQPEVTHAYLNKRRKVKIGESIDRQIWITI